MHGHRERFQRLYDDAYAPLLGYVRRRTDSIEDAHDVVSETFMTAWRRLDEVPEGDRARLWLFGTARRVLANHHRGRRRRLRLAEQLQHEHPTCEDSSVGEPASDEAVVIAAAFERLSEPDQELLILAGWEQLGADQIAQVLGCGAVAARVRLHRARKRFAARLADQGLRRPAVSGHQPTQRAAAHHDPEEAS